MTTLSDIGQTIAKFAPLLGGVVGGPAGAAIGSIVASKFGGSTTDLDDLQKRILGDSEAEIKLRQIESDNEIQLQNLAVTAENNRLTAETNQLKIQADDVANARAMNSANNKPADEATKIFLITFTCFLILGCLYGVFYLHINGDVMAIITLVLGSALSEWKNYNGYFFGTSLSSRKKDDALILNSAKH